MSSIDKSLMLFATIGQRLAMGMAGAISCYIGSWFVWQFLYSIGDRVITDEHYADWNSSVPYAGLIVGFILGLFAFKSESTSWVYLLVGNFSAVLFGCLSATQGWFLSLLVYYGILVITPILAFVRRENVRHDIDPIPNGITISSIKDKQPDAGNPPASGA